MEDEKKKTEGDAFPSLRCSFIPSVWEERKKKFIHTHRLQRRCLVKSADNDVSFCLFALVSECQGGRKLVSSFTQVEPAHLEADSIKAQTAQKEFEERKKKKESKERVKEERRFFEERMVKARPDSYKFRVP